MMENTRGGFSLSAQDARMEVTNAFFRKVYHWMTAGLILTALAAHAVASSETLYAVPIRQLPVDPAGRIAVSPGRFPGQGILTPVNLQSGPEALRIPLVQRPVGRCVQDIG